MDVAYVPLDTSPNSPYVVGRPMNKTQSITITGDNTNSEEQYSYSNSLLMQVKKKGNNTDFITEDNIYDTFGNITKKTITVPAVAPNPAPAPRITNYEYDTSGRFLTKSIDIEGLATTFIYNAYNGLLSSETNPYGLTTTYGYDAWFKKTKTTDYLSKSNSYAYSRSNNVYTLVTTTGDEGSASEETFDDLGRKTKSGVKNINGTFSYIDYLYDIYDRNYKVSEPYFGTSPTQWSETKYDVYSRISQSISFTGKTVNMSYSGLTTTVNDGAKTKISIKNAIGNVISMTDNPGGIITYTYFANGNLETSDYGGVVTTIEQDGWGRKTKLIDSSAGTYLYEYNLFGETTKETTPNGATTYTLDNVGKLTAKTIVGNPTSLTNSSTVYAYDGTTKLLTSNTFTNTLEGGAVTTNAYEYDASKRLFKTTETTPYATFTKQLSFDAFGRTDKETSTAVLLANGKASAKTIKNTYQNGYPWQILDDATSQVLWQTGTVNARGQLTTATLGNGIAITNAYDSYGFATQFKHDKAGTNIMTLNTVFDPQKGNLTSRTNSLFNWNESFLYDNLDRLTNFTNAQGLQETQNYDDRGRITQNSVGTYNYSTTAKPYQNTSVTLNPEAIGYYANREGIFNDSMEDQQGWGISRHPSNDFFSYDDTKSHSGKYSLKLSNSTTTEQYVHADKSIAINNSQDTQYTYSAWIYSDNPQAELFLFMKTATETGYFTLVHSVVTNVTNGWVHLEGTFNVPANITKLNLRLDNNGQGNIWFDDVKIRKTSNTPLSSTTFSDRQLNISYNAFKSPVEIEETGIDKISFTYNDGNDRSAMFYGSLDGDKNLRPKRKYYSADGSMEIKQNIVTGATEFVTYIGGDGYSAPIVLKSDGTNQNYLYLHRDYQGSILAITNEAGAVVEKRLFDPWGSIIKVQDGAGNVLNGLTILDRGYTGHEHLQSVGLIHMNGRLYDPKLHRFLQPDNYVQEPFNTQNYNRYGYCWNNPLKYIDPSGEFTWSDLFAAAAIVAGVIVVIASAGTLTPVAQYLIGAGAAHFLGTFASYMNNKAAGWDAASNYIGLSSPTININTGWGDSKTPKNGITQEEPVVKPIAKDDVRNMSSGGNISPAQQAIIDARKPHSFFGANVQFNAYQSGKDVYNSTYFGTIHTSRPTFNDYLMKGLDSDGGSVLMHEYGHYLHAQYAPLNFYSYGIWSSAATANSSSPMSNWTEIRANTMSYYYFGQPSYWRQNENPTNSNYLSKQEIFQLTHHLKPFNRFKP
nr:RHS repeat-associated core domain-containing protein [uncultured Flavobacterium sp.]